MDTDEEDNCRLLVASEDRRGNGSGKWAVKAEDRMQGGVMATPAP
jgi:hypothetical protein